MPSRFTHVKRGHLTPGTGKIEVDAGSFKRYF
jgi:hypothetical protein